MAGEDPSFKAHARDEFGDCIKDISELTGKGAVILPTELWIETKRLSDHVTSILVEYDKNENINSDQLVKLSAMAIKVVLVARSILGADELTEESIKIFSSKKDFENLANIETSFVHSEDEPYMSRI